MVPELNGSPRLFTNKSSVALKNFSVVGSINLNIPISTATPIIFAIINPKKGLKLNDTKISF